MDFTNEIKDWVAVDNKVRLYNEKIKELRQERTQIAENILSYANTNNLGNKVSQSGPGVRFSRIILPRIDS